MVQIIFFGRWSSQLHWLWANHRLPMTNAIHQKNDLLQIEFPPKTLVLLLINKKNPSTNLGFSQKSRKQWQILLCQVQITRTCPSTRISTFRRKVLFASFRRRRRSFRLRTCDTSRRGVPWKSTPFRSGLLCDVNSLKFKIFLYDHFTLWFCKWK